MGEVQQAAYSLDDVFRLIDQHKVVFSAPSRSILAVLAVYHGTSRVMVRADVEDFICGAIKTLTEKNFCGSQMQWGDMVVDKYGVMFDSRPWFVKFGIMDGVLEEISFHPPERELKTLSGLVIPKG